MYHSTRELWIAFIAIIAISIVYLFTVITLEGIPAASEFFGHSLGILGFLLMLMTETLYTLRKRSRSARWGKLSFWLQFHIITGLVGPYMVLLHTSWKFNGFAGIVMLMTGVVVISGFIGRYIYTAIPRTADGLEIEAGELQSRIERMEVEINGLFANQPSTMQSWSNRMLRFSAQTASGRFVDPIGNTSYRLNMWNLRRKMDSETRARVAYLGELIKRRRSLSRQRASLAQARRLMALWHTLHVPIGLALFTAAFIHIGAAIYYATLLR